MNHNIMKSYDRKSTFFKTFFTKEKECDQPLCPSFQFS